MADMTLRGAASVTHRPTRETHPNSHVRTLCSTKHNIEQWLFVASDIHWDNPKCDHSLLKQHLDEAVSLGARIILPGDTFCLMQGKNDRRGHKSAIRKHHVEDNYFDVVAEDAVEFFAPYAEHIDIIGIGNHENSILKHHEFDFLQGFVAKMNLHLEREGSDHRIAAGGYTGWYTLQFGMGMSSSDIKKGNTTGSISWTMHYDHGSDSNSRVTYGVIEKNRKMVMLDGIDCIVQGHNHNSYGVDVIRLELDDRFRPRRKSVLLVRCGTYKDAYQSGINGWEVEKGLGPKPIGGQFIYVRAERNTSKNRQDGEPGITVKCYNRKAI